MPTPDDTVTGRAPSNADIASAGMKSALEDRSKYIRTMAKDMAAITGSSAPATKKTPEPEEDTSSNKETFSGVTLEKEEQPFFERLRSKAEDRVQEAVELPSLKEASSIVGAAEPVAPRASTIPAPSVPHETERASILERLRAKAEQSKAASKEQAHTPLPEQASVMPQREETLPPLIPKPVSAPETPKESVPSPVVPAPKPATAPSEEPPRPTAEPIQPLSKPLAEKPVTESDTSKKLPAFPPLPTFDISTPLQEKDVSNKSEKPVVAAPAIAPAIERQPYREPIEPYTPPANTPALTPESFHTYTSDFANRIDSKGASAFSVLAAEQDAGRTNPAPVSTRPKGVAKGIIAVATGILLLVLAGGGVFFTYQFVTTMRDTPIASITVPSIVFADEYRKLEGTGNVLMQGLVAASNGTLVSGNVLITYILTETPAEGGTLIQTPAGGAAFMRALMIPAPDILLRNIADESTVGVIHAGTETNAFFALRVDSYERTYAGMLTWEPLMARDLGALYPLHPAQETRTEDESPTATTTASTTQAVVAPATQASARTRFEDTIVANHDVRVLKDTDGKTLMLYGYADKRTLIIARNEVSFEALLARLKSE